ncbi:MAG TPA: DUF1810 domain-containing protein [Bacteroidales bacterium]|nr:DUF1810 domain-containing protein [Bacteroidales bacterium]
MEEFKLERFVEAQNGIYDTILRELRAGRKESHWMWFVFSQLKELCKSRTAEYYGIESIEEARAYLAHPVLGSRLEECLQILLNLKTSNPVMIFGKDDAQKLHSSVTLFSYADPDNELFKKIIDKFWGLEEQETKNILTRDRLSLI